MTISHRVTAAAALAVTACAVAACSQGGAPLAAGTEPPTTLDVPASPTATSSTPAPRPRGGLPDLATLDHTDATAVSRAAVTIMWTVDATTDQGQRDAYLRAKPLLTAQYAAALAEQPQGGLAPDWRDHRAYAVVRVVLTEPEGDVDPDTATTAHRLWRITVTPTGRDGWTGGPVRATAFVTLLRRGAGEPWRVNAVGTS